MGHKSREELNREIEDLRARLYEEQEFTRAIRNGEVDALVVSGPAGEMIYTLKEADRTYRIILEEMNDGAITVNDLGVILYSNKQFAKMLGRPLSALIGSSVYDYIDPGDRVKAGGILAGSTERTGRSEIVFKGADGKTLWANVSFSPLQIDQTLIFCIVVSDITNQEESRRTLREAVETIEAERQRFFGVLETLPPMICLLTPDYLVAFANRSFRDRFGESEGRYCYDYCFGKPEPCELCESFKVLETGKPHHWEVTTPDGSIIDAYDFPFTDTDGSPMVLEMDMDITEQRRTQRALHELNRNLEQRILERTEELQKSEERFRSSLDNMLEGCQIIGSDWRYIYINNVADMHNRRSKEELLGNRYMDMWPGIESTEVFRVLKRCMEDRTAHRMEYEFVFQDGTRRWFDLSIQPVPEGIFLLSIDITERKRIEGEALNLLAELERSNKDLEQFAYVASHDLQEPLRMISSFTQLLAQRYREQLDQDARDYIDYAVTGSQRMQNLIKDLLQYSRVTTRGKTPGPVDLNAVLNEALANLQVAVREGKAVVAKGELPVVLGDRIQLVQVFQNLISNAVKFRGEADPRISIAAERAGTDWKISVADNGIGIDPQYFERIFVIFQRLHSADKYQGTGIGLALCKRIIQRLGGNMWVESEPGKGSVFYFTLQSSM